MGDIKKSRGKRDGEIMNRVLDTKGLVTGYHNRSKIQEVSTDLSLDVNEGTLTCVLGSNGIGKSTLLRTLCGLQKKISGEIFVGGISLEQITKQDLAKKMSLVLTDILDLGNMSVYSLVSLGRIPYTGLLGKLNQNDHKIVQNSLELVKGSHLINKRFMEISDGEKQKVQIARALAQDTSLLILDEPTVYLDLPGRVEILNLLKNLTLDQKVTVLMSTHELDLALKISDEIWIIDRDGGIVKGAPEDLILNGKVQDTFENEHFSFDLNSGDINLKRNICSDVTLLAEGSKYFWTKRALERNGFQVIPNSKSGKIVNVNEENDKTTWTWESGEDVKSFKSIADLFKFVRHT